MPLIDLKSDLAARATSSLNENERRAEDSSRLLKLLAGGTGLIFAAKQALLDPKSATKRLAAITAQIGLNTVPFGLGNHIGFDPNGPGLSQAVSGTAEERSIVRDRVSQYQNISTKVTDWTPYSAGPGYLDEIATGRDFTNRTAIGRDDDLNNILFYFTSYNVENGQLVNGPSLVFPSFFQSISDNVNGNWNSFSYTGRGEQFHVYQTYGRTMQINFKAAAFNYQELVTMNSKLAKLRSAAAPTYTPSQGYMKGTFLKLTIGSFVRSLPGFISSVGFTINDNVPWETEDGKLKIPHVIDVSVGYTVIEQNTPQFSF